MWHVRIVRSEAGVVLPMALIVLVVLAGLAAAVLAVGTSETNIAANHTRTAQALALAEAGLESAFTTLNASECPTSSCGATASLIDTATTASNCGSSGSDPCFQSLAVTQPATNSTLQSYGMYCVQYRKVGSNTAEVVSTGVTGTTSTTCSGGTARRVLRAIMTANLNHVTAVLSEGDITISGGTEVKGTCGSVHSNANLSVSGTGNLIAENATASGSYSTAGSPTIGGMTGGSRPKRVIPSPTAASLYSDARTAAATDANLTVYKLRSDGLVDRTIGSVTTSGLAAATAAGWAYTAQTGANAAKWAVTNTACGVGSADPCLATSPTPPQGLVSPNKAVFYVEGDAEIEVDVGADTSRWTATVIVGKYLDGATSKGGELRIGNNDDPFMSAALNDLVFAAEGNMTFSGKPNIRNGVMYSGGDVRLNGGVDIDGSIIARGTTTLAGDVKVTYNCGLNSGITTSLSVIAWGY